jgi:hypothetical protein
VSIAIGVGYAITVVEVEMTGCGIVVGTVVAVSRAGTAAQPARVTARIQKKRREKEEESMSRIPFQGRVYSLSEHAGGSAGIDPAVDMHGSGNY